jgi:hypothetical protein
MPTMRPIQFSALKVLNSLDDEPEHAEDQDREAYVSEIEHGVLQRTPRLCRGNAQ